MGMVWQYLIHEVESFKWQRQTSPSTQMRQLHMVRHYVTQEFFQMRQLRMVRQYFIQEFFNGKEPNKSLNPDKAVAHGVAVLDSRSGVLQMAEANKSINPDEAVAYGAALRHSGILPDEAVAHGAAVLHSGVLQRQRGKQVHQPR